MSIITNLIDLYWRGMQNKTLDTDAREHIERVLATEYRMRQTTGKEATTHEHKNAA